MKWSSALAWAVPVWMIVCALVIAINYAAEIGATRFDLLMGLLATYPLSAFMIKTTSDDWARWRAAFGSRDDENEKT